MSNEWPDELRAAHAAALECELQIRAALGEAVRAQISTEVERAIQVERARLVAALREAADEFSVPMHDGIGIKRIDGPGRALLKVAELLAPRVQHGGA